MWSVASLEKTEANSMYSGGRVKQLSKLSGEEPHYRS